MRIGKIGEFALIKRISRKIKVDSSVVRASGDDCAVIKYKKDKYLLATCDMLLEGVDFTSRDEPYLVGRKAMAVSVSDIAACGGIPRYALVSLGLPKTLNVKIVDKITQGMIDLAAAYKINLVGGDLSQARELTIDVSMIGVVEKKYLVLRKGAKAKDIIFVSGSLGGSIFGKHLRFIPRVKEARFLVKHLRVNSMIDISDGLAADLGHILEESRVGAVIYEALLPFSKQAKGLNDALFSGEDFELLFTLPPSQARKLLGKEAKIFHPIGEIVERGDGLRLIDKNNRLRILKPKGYHHF